MSDRDRAVRLLVNYFAAIAQHAGMRWDPDYTAEITEAVDAIVKTANDVVSEGHVELLVRRLAEVDARIDDLTRKFDLHEDRQRRDGRP